MDACGMSSGAPVLTSRRPLVVGSLGGAAALAAQTAAAAAAACDVVEIRLDLMMRDGWRPGERPWRHLEGLPLLFTARRGDEGGAGDVDAGQRADMLRAVVDDAAWVDVEVASIEEMSGLLGDLRKRSVAWVASYHDFAALPEVAVLEAAAGAAREAGAAVFKVAARMDGPGSVAALAEFQRRDHGLPVAAMGMGPLAPVSRLLCAQYGSVLNYGYLGGEATAPGQWDAGALREAISRLVPVGGVDAG